MYLHLFKHAQIPKKYIIKKKSKNKKEKKNYLQAKHVPNTNIFVCFTTQNIC